MTAPDLPLRMTTLERELQWAPLKIQVLEERWRQWRIKLLGPRGETLSNLQLELLVEEEPGVSAAEVAAAAKRETIPNQPKRKRRRHPGRQSWPAHRRRVEPVIAGAEKNCVACDAETTVIGYDESEQWDVEPTSYLVRVTKREKRAGAGCRPGTVTRPPLAPRIIEKGLASDAVVIQTVVAKYCDHLPLYRQAFMLEREAGVEIGRATLDGWAMRVGELLRPVTQAMRQDLLTATYLPADKRAK